MHLYEAKNAGQATASGETVLATPSIGATFGFADPTMDAQSYMQAQLSAAWALGAKLVVGMKDTVGFSVPEPEAEPQL